MDDLQIFEKAAALLETNENVALVTVVDTTGSTPGKIGYKMLVWARGEQTCGTIGGGLVEAEMIEQSARMLATSNAKLFQFDLGDRAQEEKGICGGSVRLLVETFDAGALPLFRGLAAAAANDAPAVLVSVLCEDRPPRKMLLPDAAADYEPTPEIAAAVEKVASCGRDAALVSAGQMQAFVESIHRPPTVIIFGAGHLSYYIAQFAKMVQFQVTVYDDRDEYANAERFPNVDRIVVRDFDQALDSVQVDAGSYVVIVTRGHRCDEIVLAQVLQTKARYVGMIGSKRKTRRILDGFKQRGYSEQQLHRVFSPIGVSIGAVTPEEIAMSIVCELVKIRRAGVEPAIAHMTLSEPGGQA